MNTTAEVARPKVILARATTPPSAVPTERSVPRWLIVYMVVGVAVGGPLFEWKSWLGGIVILAIAVLTAIRVAFRMSNNL